MPKKIMFLKNDAEKNHKTHKSDLTPKILSIVAAVFYMISMFQKKEQNVRLFLLANMSAWTIYHAVIGSTAIFAQIAGIISSLIALFRYRKKEKRDNA